MSAAQKLGTCWWQREQGAIIKRGWDSYRTNMSNRKLNLIVQNTIKKHLENKKTCHLFRKESGDKGCSDKTLIQSSWFGCKRNFMVKSICWKETGKHWCRHTAVLINPGQHSLLPFLLFSNGPCYPVTCQLNQHLILRKTVAAIMSRIALVHLDSTVCQDCQNYHESLIFMFLFFLKKCTLKIFSYRIPQNWTW